MGPGMMWICGRRRDFLAQCSPLGQLNLKALVEGQKQMCMFFQGSLIVWFLPRNSSIRRHVPNPEPNCRQLLFFFSLVSNYTHRTLFLVLHHSPR